MKSLRIGCVKYLNARPLIRGWPGPVTFDDPAALCAQLARGNVDLALVSSFEFLRNPIYRIVDEISISSDGPVYSVFVAHVGEIADLKEIELDPASETSVKLLRCLLAESNLKPRLVAGSTSPFTSQRGRLLIGDQAIRFRQEHGPQLRFWDLGEEWKRIVGLPFVYALWLMRPELSDAPEIASQLRRLRDQNAGMLDEIAAAEKGVDPAFCSRYYRKHLRFSFGEGEKEGLRAFAILCTKHNLLPTRELAFDLV